MKSLPKIVCHVFAIFQNVVFFIDLLSDGFTLWFKCSPVWGQRDGPSPIWVPDHEKKVFILFSLGLSSLSLYSTRTDAEGRSLWGTGGKGQIWPCFEHKIEGQGLGTPFLADLNRI